MAAAARYIREHPGLNPNEAAARYIYEFKGANRRTAASTVLNEGNGRWYSPVMVEILKRAKLWGPEGYAKMKSLDQSRYDVAQQEEESLQSRQNRAQQITGTTPGVSLGSGKRRKKGRGMQLAVIPLSQMQSKTEMKFAELPLAQVGGRRRRQKGGIINPDPRNMRPGETREQFDERVRRSGEHMFDPPVTFPQSAHDDFLNMIRNPRPRIIKYPGMGRRKKGGFITPTEEIMRYREPPTGVFAKIEKLFKRNPMIVS